MNSLFTRTLLWFIATVFLTHVAIMVAAVLDDDETERRRSPLRTLLTVELNEARHAFEAGGTDELRSTLARFESAGYGDRILTTSDFRDVLTNVPRPELRHALERRTHSGLWRRNRTVLAQSSADGRYVYFMVVPAGGLVRWFLQPEIQLTILGVLTVLSYAFARFLTNPVRQLQTAVECFGRGDLRTRVHSNRKDEIGQLARTFDQMADRIQTLLAAERRLLLDISHELRSPLTRLNLAVELARSGDDVNRHLERIDKEADRLNTLVSELLQVTRAEGDEKRMLRESVDLTASVAAVIEDAEIEAVERGCRVVWGQRQQATLAGDSELIRRAVENVVRNAIRYTAPGTSVVVSVCIVQIPAGPCAQVTVRDYGPGVPEEDLTRIFDPFYRVQPDRDRTSGGAGLGLSIARRAIELHHGNIHARNANPGLEVTITLPVDTANRA